MSNENPVKISKVRRSWLLLKSSMLVLRLDKELITFPLLNSLLIVALLASGVGTLFAYNVLEIDIRNDSFSFINHWGYGITPLLIIAFVVFSFISNFFSAAITYGALERFKGGDPSVRGSLAVARKKWKPLLYFSLMMATVGIILSYLQDLASRLPIIGAVVAQIIINIAGFAWGVANFFSVAHIVSTDEDISPLVATKKSVATIKKVWGESVVANAGLGIVMTVLTLFVVTFGVTGAVLLAVSGNVVSAFGFGSLAFLVLCVVALVSEALGSILKSAIFYYAETGAAPEAFDKDLLKASMTPKKAKKVFGGTSKDRTWA